VDNRDRALRRYEQILNYVIAMDFLFFGLTATTIFVFAGGPRAAR